MADWMIKRLIVQGREMESQIAARDRALLPAWMRSLSSIS